MAISSISANNNICVRVLDAGESGNILVNRLLIAGTNGINVTGIGCAGEGVENVYVRNNIIYECDLKGISVNTSNRVINISNNTIVGCNKGVFQDHATSSGNFVCKNNLCQNNTIDYDDDGGGFGTSANNISQDATSPDAAYRNITVTFIDEANDDYHLSSASTDAKDQGENLSATFTDDIDGNSRSSATAGSGWDIGADEIMQVGVRITGGVRVGPP